MTVSSVTPTPTPTPTSRAGNKTTGAKISLQEIPNALAYNKALKDPSMKDPNVKAAVEATGLLFKIFDGAYYQDTKADGSINMSEIFAVEETDFDKNTLSSFEMQYKMGKKSIDPRSLNKTIKPSTFFNLLKKTDSKSDVSSVSADEVLANLLSNPESLQKVREYLGLK